MTNIVVPTVYITCVATGETRTMKNYGGITWDLDYPGADFIWSEGNFACDCNRALFFEEAIGNDDPDRECGSEAYTVRIVAPNGDVLYDEGAAP